LRLLLVSQPLGEGVPRHVLDVVRSLDADRYEIDVACPRSSTLWRDLEGGTDVRLHELAPTRRPSSADVMPLFRLLRLVRRADVVHAHSSKAGFLARLAALVRGRTEVCIFTPHAWSFWAAEGREARLYRQFERLAARWCGTILVVSRHERDAGLAAGVGTKEQYRVVPNGVDGKRFSTPPEPVPGRVLFVGRLATQKRPDIAVRAFARVRELYPEAELQIVGDGPARGDVEALVDFLGLRPAVRFSGTRDDVPALLSRAACVILSSDYEGCPFTVIEAMAAGAPVVATRVGGVPELVEHGVTGLLVEPRSPEALAVGVSELLANPELANRMGAAGRVAVRKHFSVERMVEGVATVYEQVAAHANGRHRRSH
jgi:glycosyltransferase involved in cell wall biosynthesis